MIIFPNLLHAEATKFGVEQVGGADLAFGAFGYHGVPTFRNSAYFPKESKHLKFPSRPIRMQGS